MKKKAKKSKKRITRHKAIVAPLTCVVNLTQKEVDAFNSFTEERLMVLKCFKPKFKMREEQWEETRAVIFNGLVAAYVAGINLKSRVYKTQLTATFDIKIIKRRS